MMSFYEFQRQFPDDEACLHRIMVERYGGTELDCPKCGEHGKFYRMTRERAYVCQHCKHQLHPTVGTPMERSRTPLHKWFYAMYLFTTTRHGVSAKELQRQLDDLQDGVAHGTRDSQFMAEVDGETPLGGTVEADETYVGGKRSGGKKGRGAPNKTIAPSGCWNAVAMSWRRSFRTSASGRCIRSSQRTSSRAAPSTQTSSAPTGAWTGPATSTRRSVTS